MDRGPAVIIPAYSRSASLQRLLNSIKDSTLFDGAGPLILSLDGGFTSQVEKVAEEFASLYSSERVQIVKRSHNIGLREHILWCGDQTEKYGSVVVLEDDLWVDPQFYDYASAALQYYSVDDRISGISLYSYRFNEFAGLPFEPLQNGSSGFFMQVVSSWGQAWTRSQWTGFRSWYAMKSARIQEILNALPPVMRKWPESSWKKYYSGYLVDTGRFFFYPYQSYTTNCSDAGGTHMTVQTDVLQSSIALSSRPQDSYRFAHFDGRSVKYDAFMEPASEELFSRLGYSESELEIDLYGIKPLSMIKKKPYVITVRRPLQYLCAFRLSFRPIENLVLAPYRGAVGRLHSYRFAFLAPSSALSDHMQPWYKLFRYYSLLHDRYQVLPSMLFRELWARIVVAISVVLQRAERKILVFKRFR